MFDTITISPTPSTFRRDEIASPKESLMPKVGTTTEIPVIKSGRAFSVLSQFSSSIATG
jgi:hypothetical protein